jgi:hypothetical protein
VQACAVVVPDVLASRTTPPRISSALSECQNDSWCALSPGLRKHKGMDLQRRRYRLDLQARLMTETNSPVFKLDGVLVPLAPSRSWHV